MIKELNIKNFRGLEALEKIECDAFNIFIGDNGTSKTTILEAINHAFSPNFLAGRIKHLDGFNLKYTSPFFKEFVLRCPVPAEEVILRAAESGLGLGPKLSLFADDLVLAGHASPKRRFITTLLEMAFACNADLEIDEKYNAMDQ